MAQKRKGEDGRLREIKIRCYRREKENTEEDGRLRLDGTEEERRRRKTKGD